MKNFNKNNALLNQLIEEFTASDEANKKDEIIHVLLNKSLEENFGEEWWDFFRPANH